MKYVIDASIAPKWFIAEADSGIAVRLLKEYNQGIHELIAPELFVAEVANSILSAENSGREPFPLLCPPS